jgi:ribosomal protein L37AE/L43A
MVHYSPVPQESDSAEIRQGQATMDGLVISCGVDWEPLGIAAGFESVDEARKKTERLYRGISGKWLPSKLNMQKAKEMYEAELEAESCSFCGRTMLQVTAMIGEQVRICNHCIDKFYATIRNNAEQT